MFECRYNWRKIVNKLKKMEMVKIGKHVEKRGIEYLVARLA